ncbi:glycosyltransferase family A protein [Aeromonas media]|uniref:glycosyltransferase family A protein n=1 Tax=Aeromonas media TaxID=651 RepID=UPI002282D3C0|nr:glycosyltransferase family A protein [Aeromonas media]MCY9835206.1 glycosyltransferase family A protein [Aeromonas media]
MFYYAIPLRAKQTSKNWDEVCQLLESTIKSIAAGGGDYRIVVACHDKPEFASGYQNDSVSFVKVWHPIPADRSGYMADKSTKKNVARRKILETAKPGDFFMFIDADDLVSKDFLHQVESMFSRNPDADDLTFYTGYVFDARRGKISYFDGISRIFYKSCGSCFVSKLDARDCSGQEEEKDTFLFSLQAHANFPDSSLAFGRSVLAMKTPVVCYIMNHSSNDTNERATASKIESFIDSFICKDEQYIERYHQNFK